jgi:hypothetical protein
MLDQHAMPGQPDALGDGFGGRHTAVPTSGTRDPDPHRPGARRRFEQGQRGSDQVIN